MRAARPVLLAMNLPRGRKVPRKEHAIERCPLAGPSRGSNPLRGGQGYLTYMRDDAFGVVAHEKKRARSGNTAALGLAFPDVKAISIQGQRSRTCAGGNTPFILPGMST
jgi:hypothetical protein